MIRLQQLSLYRGDKLLLQGGELAIHAGWKVGITGKNGCGKSSLFAMLTGELQPDAGELQLPADWRIVSVEQEILALDRSALDYVLDGHHEYRRLQRRRDQVAAVGDNQRAVFASRRPS